MLSPAHIVFVQEELHMWIGRIDIPDSRLVDILHPDRPMTRKEFVCVIAEDQNNGTCELSRQAGTGAKRLLTHHRDILEAQAVASRWVAGRFGRALGTGDHWRPVWWQE